MSRFGAAPVMRTAAVIVIGSNPGASKFSCHSPDRATTKMKRPRSSVAVVNVMGETPGIPPVAARTIAPLIGPPVSSRTTPEIRLVWATAGAAITNATAAANTEVRLVSMGEVYRTGYERCERCDRLIGGPGAGREATAHFRGFCRGKLPIRRADAADFILRPDRP